MPGSTDTPLARSQTDLWLGFGRDYRDEIGTKPSTPAQQAYPLVFLCSDGAAYVNGITTNLGYVSAGITVVFGEQGSSGRDYAEFFREERSPSGKPDYRWAREQVWEAET